MEEISNSFAGKIEHVESEYGKSSLEEKKSKLQYKVVQKNVHDVSTQERFHDNLLSESDSLLKSNSSKAPNIYNVDQKVVPGKKGNREQVLVKNVRKEDLDFANQVASEEISDEEVGKQTKELFDLVNGKHNVGELKLTSEGKLDRINSHVGAFAGLNNVRLTPEQNLAVRRHVCKVFMQGYSQSPVLTKVMELLLGEDSRTSALSRDEVRFLFGMIATKKPGQGQADREHRRWGIADDWRMLEYSEENFKKLHEFKIGKSVDENSVKDFVAGLSDDFKDDAKAQRIARSVTVNAQQGLVPNILGEIRESFRKLSGNGKGRVNASDFFHMLQRKVGGNGVRHDYRFEGYEMIGGKDVDLVIERINRNYQLPKNLQLAANSKRETAGLEGLFNAVRSDLYKKFLAKIEEHCAPISPKVAIAKQQRLQQTTKDLGSVVSVINALIQSSEKTPLMLLNLNLGNDSCRLHDESGKLREYKFAYYRADADEPVQTTLGKIIREHVKDCNKRLLDKGKKTLWDLGSVQTACRMLGVEFEDQLQNDIGENLVATLAARQEEGHKTVLSMPKQNRFYTLSLNHPENYRANLVPEKGGAVGFRAHVISNMPDGPNGEHEYDVVFRFEKLQELQASGSLNIVTPIGQVKGAKIKADIVVKPNPKPKRQGIKMDEIKMDDSILDEDEVEKSEGTGEINENVSNRRDEIIDKALQMVYPWLYPFKSDYNNKIVDCVLRDVIRVMSDNDGVDQYSKIESFLRKHQKDIRRYLTVIKDYMKKQLPKLPEKGAPEDFRFMILGSNKFSMLRKVYANTEAASDIDDLRARLQLGDEKREDDKDMDEIKLEDKNKEDVNNDAVNKGRARELLWTLENIENYKNVTNQQKDVITNMTSKVIWKSFRDKILPEEARSFKLLSIEKGTEGKLKLCYGFGEKMRLNVSVSKNGELKNPQVLVRPYLQRKFRDKFVSMNSSSLA